MAGAAREAAAYPEAGWRTDQMYRTRSSERRTTAFWNIGDEVDVRGTSSRIWLSVRRCCSVRSASGTSK